MLDPVERLRAQQRRLEQIRAIPRGFRSFERVGAALDAWLPATRECLEVVIGTGGLNRWDETVLAVSRSKPRDKAEALAVALTTVIAEFEGAGTDAPLVHDLKQWAAGIDDQRVRAFVEEAVGCYAAGYWRAAVVLSWVGAVALLHRHIIEHRLTAFNAEALRRDGRRSPVASVADLGQYKEHDILQIAAAIGMIDKNTKQELEQRLQLRNSFGHPTNLGLSKRMAAAHLESLLINVYAVF